MPASSVLEAALKRDRLIVIAGLATVTAISWAYILAGAGMGMSAFDTTPVPGGSKEMGGAVMTGMGTTMAAMTAPATWTFGYALLMLAMWWVMMVAMMIPSAAPVILLHAAVTRRNGETGSMAVPTALFASSYLVAWGMFSTGAVALQWGLERSDLLSPMMALSSSSIGGTLLLVAGLYQLSPLKHACLRYCRGPMDFLTRHWRKGYWGAFRMGFHHGLYCLGCCWALMVLLFVGGVMNLLWIGGLALFVLLEKVIPPGHRLASLSGLLLIGWGVVTIAATGLTVS